MTPRLPPPMPATVRATNNIPSDGAHATSRYPINEMTCEIVTRLAAELVAERTPKGSRDRRGNRHDRKERTHKKTACAVLLREIRQERNHDHVPKHIDQRDGVDRNQRAKRRSGLGRHPHTRRDLGLTAGLRIINVMTAQNAKMTLAIRNSAR